MTSTPAATSLSFTNDYSHSHQQQIQPNPSSSSAQPYDFWEFVSCGKCHLPFINDNVQDTSGGPSIPFWLTECGHILCNQHLNPNQSCPCCGADGIEVIPLHRELPPPMSDWFQSTPHKLDGLAQAVKFQQDSLISQIRYYKRKVRKFEISFERVRQELQEVKALKMEVEQLRQENANLQQSMAQQPRGQYQIQAEPSDMRNVNGKRRMLESHYRLTSSPRSIMTPIAPTRLTLGPDHEPPSLPVKNNNTQIVMDGSHPSQQLDRPGTNQFAQPLIPDVKRNADINIRKYSYAPVPQTPRGRNQQNVLSHAQQAPLRRAVNLQQTPNPMLGQQMQVPGQGNGRNMRLQQNDMQAQRMMPPPPTPLHVRQAQAIGGNGQARRQFVPQQQQINGQGMMMEGDSVSLDDPQGNFQNQQHMQGQYQSQRAPQVVTSKFRPVLPSRQGQGQNVNQVQMQQHQQQSGSGSGFSFSSNAQPQAMNQSSRRFVVPVNASTGTTTAQTQLRGNRMVPATPSGGRFSAMVAPTPSNRNSFKPSTALGGSRAQAGISNQAFMSRNRSLGAAST